MTDPKEALIERRWSYSINYGPDGQEDWANLTTPDGQHVANIRTGHAIAIVNGMNADALASLSASVGVTDEMVATFKAEIAKLMLEDLSYDETLRLALEAALSLPSSGGEVVAWCDAATMAALVEGKVGTVYGTKAEGDREIPIYAHAGGEVVDE